MGIFLKLLFRNQIKFDKTMKYSEICYQYVVY